MLEYILLAFFVLLTGLYSTWIFTISVPRKASGTSYTPPVSIIIPAHNEENFIERAISSVVKDNYPHKEIIVVDDGSIDRTASIVRRFRNVKLLKTYHTGKSAALNKGLSIAKSSIIITLDADSVIADGSIAELVRPLRDRKVGASTGIIRARRTINPLTWFQDYEYIMSSGWRYACTNIDGNSIVPGFAAFSRRALKKIGGFSSETMTEDFDVVISMRKAGFRTVTVNKASITTEVPHTFSSLIRQRLRWGRGTIQVIRKHSRFIASRDSGPMGYFTVPNQFYWYVHALLYVPVILYMMLVVWSRSTILSSGVLSPEFLAHIITMFSIYGIVDLIIKVAAHEYSLTVTILISLLMFFLSMAYTVIVFVKVSRPGVGVLIAYVFFFPYSMFNLSILAVSAFQAIVRPRKENKWNT